MTKYKILCNFSGDEKMKSVDYAQSWRTQTTLMLYNNILHIYTRVLSISRRKINDKMSNIKINPRGGKIHTGA